MMMKHDKQKMMKRHIAGNSATLAWILWSL